MADKLTYKQMHEIAKALIASGALNDRDGNPPRVEQVIPAVMYAQETFGSPLAVTLLAFQNNKGRISFSPSGDAFAALFFQTGGRVAVDFDEKNVSIEVTAEHPRLLKPVTFHIDLDEALRRGLITPALHKAIKSRKPSNDRAVKYSPWFKNPMRMLFLQVIRELARMIGLGGGVYAVWRAVQGPAEIAEEIIKAVSSIDIDNSNDGHSIDDEGESSDGERGYDDAPTNDTAKSRPQKAVVPSIEGWPYSNPDEAGKVMKWVAAMKKMLAEIDALRRDGRTIAGEKNIGGLRTYIYGKMKEAAYQYALAAKDGDEPSEDETKKYLKQLVEWFELVTGETSLREAPDDIVLALFYLMKQMEEKGGDTAIAMELYFWLQDRNAAVEQAQQMLDDLLAQKEQSAE